MTYDEYKLANPWDDELDKQCKYCGNPCKGKYCSNGCKIADVKEHN